MLTTLLVSLGCTVVGCAADTSSADDDGVMSDTSDLTAAHGTAIARLALDNNGKGACTTDSAGGRGFDANPARRDGNEDYISPAGL